MTDGGRVVGSVRTADLVGAANVAAVMKRLEDCALLSMDAELSVLLSALADSPMVFLVGPNGLQAFVTPSDLERHAARAHFYLLVSSIEPLITALDELTDLRNTVMHSVKPLSDHRSPPRAGRASAQLGRDHRAASRLPALNGPPLGNRAVRMTVP